MSTETEPATPATIIAWRPAAHNEANYLKIDRAWLDPVLTEMAAVVRAGPIHVYHSIKTHGSGIKIVSKNPVSGVSHTRFYLQSEGGAWEQKEEADLMRLPPLKVGVYDRRQIPVRIPKKKERRRETMTEPTNNTVLTPERLAVMRAIVDFPLGAGNTEFPPQLSSADIRALLDAAGRVVGLEAENAAWRETATEIYSGVEDMESGYWFRNKIDDVRHRFSIPSDD